MDQTVLSFDQKTCFDKKIKTKQIKLALLLKKNDQSFIERTIPVKPYYL